MDAKYLEEREQLIAQDRALRVDAHALTQASEAEKKAEEIVRRIRAKETESVWGPNAPEIPGATHVFPGMAFLTAKETIRKTQLYKIIGKMPKGGVLHAHLDATVNAEAILQIALKYPAIHVRTRAQLTPTSLPNTFPEFHALPKEEWTTLPNISGDEYVPGTWVPLNNARSTFAAELGGPSGFDKWARDAMTISPAESYGTHNTTDKIWQRFGQTFDITRGLTRYFPVFVEYVRELLLASVEDGISYLEVRMALWYKTMIGEDGRDNVPHREWLIAYDRIINEVKAELASQGRADAFVGSRVIYSCKRSATCDELEWYLEDCLQLKREFSHLICGFDLVGHEDSLKPLIYYLEPLKRFVERQKELGLDIPFIFHAGETLGDGTAPDMNLFDAVLLGTKRIGHGFSLAKHPKLMEVCRERQIAVEVCPISNEVLRYTGSMPMHPLPILMNQGIHVALSNDDPGMFGYMGLSFDFFQVLVASEVTGLLTLRELAKDSIRYSSLEPEERSSALAAYEKHWTNYVGWIINTFDKLAT